MVAIAARTADTVRCGPAGKDTVTALAGAPGRATDTETRDSKTWSRLNSFAHRTYAPATEASQVLGAGAGLIDAG
jgi:hypothetical protein